MLDTPNYRHVYQIANMYTNPIAQATQEFANIKAMQ